MGVEIKFSQSYFWLDSWIMSNIIQLGTVSFCDRFVDYKIDPCRRLYDQMVLAARCCTANIAEGTSRYSTSIETEMRLLDVARASLDELQAYDKTNAKEGARSRKGILGLLGVSKL